MLNTTTSAIEGSTATSEQIQPTGLVDSTASVTLGNTQTPTQTDSIQITSTSENVGDISESTLDPSITSSNSRNKIHLEESETGFESFSTKMSGGAGRNTKTESPSPTPTPGPDESIHRGIVSSSGSIDNFRPHLESSEDGLNAILPESTITEPPVLPTLTLNNKVFTPQPVTNVEIGDTTLVPGGDTATHGEGPSATKVFVDPSGNPVIVVGTSTSTYQAPVTVGDKTGYALPSGGLVVNDQTLTQGGPPITVDTGAGPTVLSIDNSGQTLAVVNGETKTYEAPATQALSIGDITATAVAHDQYVVGSSTLTVGQTITSDGVVIALTTDATGATILIDGSTTTTLAPPSSGIAIKTTVISGTTMYVVGSETLAPGVPVTVNGTPMSITTSAGATILVIGDTTTTITGSPQTTLTTGFGGTNVAVATPADLTSGSPSPTETGKKGGASHQKSWNVCALGGMGFLVAILGFG